MNLFEKYNEYQRVHKIWDDKARENHAKVMAIDVGSGKYEERIQTRISLRESMAPEEGRLYEPVRALYKELQAELTKGCVVNETHVLAYVEIDDRASDIVLLERA